MLLVGSRKVGRLNLLISSLMILAAIFSVALRRLYHRTSTHVLPSHILARSRFEKLDSRDRGHSLLDSALA